MSLRLQDQIKGGLFGVAIGDALGGTTEFMDRNEIMKKHGYLKEIIGGGVWQLEKGEVTDDTMMTICVAEGICENPHQPMHAIGEKFLAWYRTDPKDIGNIIRRVLSTYRGNWLEAAFGADLDLGQSAGNGSLMRCLPVGLSYPNAAEMEKQARMQSKMTHYDNRCNEACEIYSRIVFRLLHQESLTDSIEQEIRHSAYARLLKEGPNCEPSGFVVHSFSWVLHILLHANSFLDVVQQAANLGGDSDTIAAIAGGLAGVHCGYEQIPDSHSGVILIKDQLESLSQRIYELRLSLL
ncbi:ADP-ribosylglycohydrolase family protein [Paenibacillus eucommiae]|uniref:ADP-ribosyl-[dinitrogen reductase] hydrolase n=1 Tax=Paenibacillus eucommiae TaxID=1355755 RepID=A0ABS4IX16_9BACL|nr:ADP-ribosylglycohydrolase family protein [Paenibacillus eucommiae]MBP1992119.1 ADP-ribosyl-[dinitrogen reductase] hydrolase [Paenibacillus eucommiae]